MATSRTTERPALPTSSEPAAARHLNGLCKYVVEKRLQKSLEKACVEVMKGTEVPRNPYPVFVQRARQQAERIRLSSWTILEGFQSSMTFPTEPTALGHVAGSKGFTHVWGHPAVLRCVSPPAIERTAWLIEDITPPLSILRCSQPYTIQVLPALTGPSIFSNTLVPAPHELAILQLYVIAGPDLERASALYADCVLGDVLRTVQQGRHYLLRVKVPSSSEGHFDLFSKEEVEARRSAFLSGVQRSLKTQLPVQADCVWRADPQGTAFQGGVKLYSLCVLQTAETLGGEKVLDFSECPLIHLYSSVFLHQAHAEAYVRMFLPAKGHPGPTVRHGESGGWSPAPRGDPIGPIRDTFLKKLAALHPSRQPFLAAHLCILILLLELGDHGNVSEDQQLEPLRQINAFLHGAACQLWTIRSLCRTICHLLLSRQTEGDSKEACQALAARLKTLMQAFLSQAHKEHEGVSSDFHVMTRVLNCSLDALLADLNSSSSLSALDKWTQWWAYSEALGSQLMADTFPWVPILTDLKRIADQRMKKPRRDRTTASRPVLAPTDQRLISEDLLYGRMPVYNLETAGKRQNGGDVGLDAKFTQYLVDCRLDQHWLNCLQDILGANPLPANPYPRVVNEFRRAVLRMDLWGEPSSRLLHRILSSQPTLCERGLRIYRCPGGEGFGLESATRATHPELLAKALRRLQLLESPPPQAAGGLQVTTSLALHAPGSWLGTLTPFLCSLEVTEFCYITAPPGCLPEVLQAYAKTVHHQLCELGRRSSFAPCGVFFGSKERWTLDKVINFPFAFSEDFIQAMQARQEVYLKVLLIPSQPDWRFVPLVKHFVLYYMSPGTHDWLCFPHHEPTTVYQVVFQTLEEAVFHVRMVGPPGDPFSCANLQVLTTHLDPQIQQNLKRGDLLQAYRLLALRGLTTKEDGCLPACWRMLHSMSAQLEYLRGLSSTLQDYIAMNRNAKIAKRRAEDRDDSVTALKDNIHFDAMLASYRDILKMTLENPCCLSAPGLRESLLQGWSVDRADGKMESWPVDVLDEWLKNTSSACQALADATASDVHALCPEIAVLLDNLERPAVRARIHTATPPKLEVMPAPAPVVESDKPKTFPSVRRALESW